MWRDPRWLGLTIALAFLGTAAPAAPADRVIVVAADAPAAERRAAEELRDAIAEATGVRLGIVAESPAGRPALAIGRASGLKTDGLGDEGFTIRVADGRVAIAGGSPRGTLYGVYSFLEDEYGVRYLTADCTSTPRPTPRGPRRAIVPPPVRLAVFLLQGQRRPPRACRPPPQQRGRRRPRAGGPLGMDADLAHGRQLDPRCDPGQVQPGVLQPGGRQAPG